MLPQIVLEAIDENRMFVTVNGNRLAAVPVRRDQVPAALAELVEQLGSPTRVEIHELDGSIQADILAPPPPASTFAPPEPNPTTPKPTPFLEFAAAGFVPGEEVMLALVLRHASASADGTVRALLDRRETPALAGEVVLVGRISQTISVHPLT